MRSPRLLCVAPFTVILMAMLMGGCIPDPLSEQVDTPVFSPSGCTFQTTIDVAIDCGTDGATVRYTLDGTEPSESDGNIYEGPFTLTETAVVKAIAYMDGMDSSDVASAAYFKQALPSTVTISEASASGTLTEGEIATLEVSCVVTPTNATVESVTADLSQLGGSANQALTASGGQWTWSGAVTPTSHGQKTVTFTAHGSDSASDVETATISVAPPLGAPTIADAAVIGTLTVGESADVMVECTVSISGGTVDTVTADLSAIGGDAAQALTGAGQSWTWSGNVTPAQGGLQTITFTASGNGKTSNATATIYVTETQPGTLAGTWNGDVWFYEVAKWGYVIVGKEGSYTNCTVTFDANYQPATLPVCVGNSPQIVLLPTATLLAVGDHIEANVPEVRSGQTRHVVATVTGISRSATEFVIELDLVLGTTNPWQGRYVWSGTYSEADDTLTWSETTDWDLGSYITENVTSSAVLTRQ